MIRSRHQAAAGFAVVVVVVVSCFVGCDLRPSLAQSGLFAGYRPELLAQCCECLASRGTGHPEATCSEGVLVDGGITVDEDAVVGNGKQELEGNDEVDDGEIPCLCSGSASTCREQLDLGRRVTIPGACLDQLDRTAPCESACSGIINFDPVPAR